MGIAEKVMQKFYRKAAGDPRRLPWHQEEVPAILEKPVRAVPPTGRRALDVGCGAGVFSVWLAEQGMDVTGIDLFPEAIEMASARARERKVNVEFVQGDLFKFAPARPFDLVFDSGCLHSLVGGGVDDYKRKVLEWLAPGGDYVLGHWGKRHAFDWRPIGPRRRSIETIETLFRPELRLVETEVKDFKTPLPVGPVVRGVGYWFKRG